MGQTFGLRRTYKNQILIVDTGHSRVQLFDILSEAASTFCKVEAKSFQATAAP